MVEIEAPQDQIISKTVFEDDAMALSAMRGVYSDMYGLSGFMSGYPGSITHMAGMSADEFRSGSSFYVTFEHNSLIPSNTDIKMYCWDPAYKIIYYCNAILEGITQSSKLKASVVQQLRGECKFIRALTYFYLTEFYGDVPVATTTDYNVNNSLSRSPRREVYDFIMRELEEAASLLPNDFSASGGKRVQSSRLAVKALQARVSLYLQDWENAAAFASEVIGEDALVGMEDSLQDVFLAVSREAIFQLHTSATNGTNEASIFLPVSGGNPNYVYLTSQLIAAFEPGDKRWEKWVMAVINDVSHDTFHLPAKYREVQVDGEKKEFYMVLRLAEQYLIRAEARARLGNIDGAQDDLNMIRNRAGLEDTDAATSPALLDAIMHERRIEFFAEFGHRWFDLKRTGQADAVLKDIKLSWEATDTLYPIPQTDRSNNPNLTQNEGY